MAFRSEIIAVFLVCSTQAAVAATQVEVQFTIIEEQVRPIVQTFRTRSARTLFTIEGDQITDNNAGYIHYLKIGETFTDDNRLHHWYNITYQIARGDIIKQILYPDHHLETIRVRLKKDGTCSAKVIFKGMDNGKWTDSDSAGTPYENSSVRAEGIVCTVQITVPVS